MVAAAGAVDGDDERCADAQHAFLGERIEADLVETAVAVPGDDFAGGEANAHAEAVRVGFAGEPGAGVDAGAVGILEGELVGRVGEGRGRRVGSTMAWDGEGQKADVWLFQLCALDTSRIGIAV